MTEKLLNKAIYVAQCGQENPIEVYRDEGGYEYQCTQHGRQASRKILFLTPKGEVEFPYGPRYFCDLCEVPRTARAKFPNKSKWVKLLTF